LGVCIGIPSKEGLRSSWTEIGGRGGKRGIRRFNNRGLKMGNLAQRGGIHPEIEKKGGGAEKRGKRKKPSKRRQLQGLKDKTTNENLEKHWELLKNHHSRATVFGSCRKKRGGLVGRVRWKKFLVSRARRTSLEFAPTVERENTHREKIRTSKNGKDPRGAAQLTKKC